jgi:alkylated DNA repair dioxygenase AlkB
VEQGNRTEGPARTRPKEGNDTEAGQEEGRKSLESPPAETTGDAREGVTSPRAEDASVVRPRSTEPVALSLFDEVPEGFRYRDEFLSSAEEAELLERIGEVAFSNFEMRGAVARRRVAFFGIAYNDADEPALPLPDFLRPFRARLAGWAGVAADDFAMALINEYRPGAPIGWHRDAPQYGIVAGLSVGSPCRMKFRPYVSPRAVVRHVDAPRRPRRATHEIQLAPRSAYVMAGPSRTSYEHAIPPVAALRYSVTFRTLRGGGRG